MQTIEHLLSAIAGLGIDNLAIDISGEEVPILDGSAASFVFLLQSAGIEEQNAAKKFVRIKKSVKVEDGDKWARFDPFDGFKVNFEIEFDHPVFRQHSQRATMEFSTGSFLREIARARTFGFMRDLEYMRSRNLALGGNLDNAIVLDEPVELRYDSQVYRPKNADGEFLGPLTLRQALATLQFTRKTIARELVEREKVAGGWAVQEVLHDVTLTEVEQEGGAKAVEAKLEEIVRRGRYRGT